MGPRGRARGATFVEPLGLALERSRQSVPTGYSDLLGELAPIDRPKLRDVHTLAWGIPASPRRSRTLPGMSASRRFVVIAATTTVEIALRLKRSCFARPPGVPDPPGAEPSGAPKCSQWMAP